MLYTGSSGPCHWSVIQGAMTEADTDAFVAHLRRLASDARAGQLALEIAYDMPMPTPVQRRRIVEVLNGSPKLELVAGHALVVNSQIGRGLLTAINWVVRPPFEERVFSRPDDALGWLRERNPDFDPQALLRSVESTCPGFARLRW